jgi:hypothetical protein
VSFPNYEALIIESKPHIAGANVRLRLLRRGAEMERERIIEMLKPVLMLGDGLLYDVKNLVALIRSGE